MSHTISVQVREISGRATNHLREAGKVPGIVYGFDIEPMKITLDRNQAEKLHSQAGESTVVDLQLDDKTHPVLIQDIQRDPLTDFITHVDFRRIDLTKKVETTIPIVIIGESSAVKESGGTLIQMLDEVEVSALPTALVRELQVDCSVLKTFDDVIRVKDLTVPEGVEILTELESSIATVQPPRSAEEMAELDKAVEVDVSKVEVEKEKKETEEEAAEGEGEKEKDVKKDTKKESKK